LRLPELKRRDARRRTLLLFSAYGTCAIVVRKALERVPAVSTAAITFGKKTVTVTLTRIGSSPQH
jgi:hypothetical protein